MLTPISSYSPSLDSSRQSSSLPNSNGFSGLLIKSNIAVNEGHQRDSFEIFNAILQKAYRKIAFNPVDNTSRPTETIHGFSSPSQSELSDYESVDKISSQQAADTILKFIGNRIRSDASNGASQEQLLERLDQGLQGFIQGFDEAKEQIEALGLLTPELSGEINDTFERVTSGVEQLRERIIDKTSSVDDNNDVEDNFITTATSRVRLAAETSESSSFSLALTTQDGDLVTIDISRASQSSFSAGFENSSNGSSLLINQQSSSSASFSLNVTGELDEGELNAINQLLQDVDAIANDFFGGRFEQAFELAVELDINREELSSLNLQLQKTTTTRALAEYQSTAQNNLPSADAPQTSTTSPFSELTHLLDSLESILEEAKKFSEPLQLINDLSAGLENINYLKQEQNTDISLFNKLESLISQFEI